MMLNEAVDLVKKDKVLIWLLDFTLPAQFLSGSPGS